MDALREAIEVELINYHPMTLRQLYYVLVSRGVIAKTENDYKAVGRQLLKLRRTYVVPFASVSDTTRWMRKPRTYGSMQQALDDTVQTYRRALWDDQGVYVEVWTEKDAIAGVLLEETVPWDVPLMVSRGYSSETYLNSAGETIADIGKPAFIYFLGDHDPSGRDITRTVEKGLRTYAPGADITFVRLAVTEEQIALYRLPMRPTKTTDSRAKNFKGKSVEVDAIPPAQLRGLLREAIESHIDEGARQRTLRIEQRERATISRLVDGLRRKS
jgi:hypothetical protein